MEDTLEQIQTDINTQLGTATGNTAPAIWKIITRIVIQIQKSKLNQADNILQIENMALKKKLEDLNHLMNGQNTQIEAFTDILKISHNLTVPERITEAGELMTELEKFRAKK